MVIVERRYGNSAKTAHLTFQMPWLLGKSAEDTAMAAANSGSRGRRRVVRRVVTTPKPVELEQSEKTVKAKQA